jgi:hypothetical protein
LFPNTRPPSPVLRKLLIIKNFFFLSSSGFLVGACSGFSNNYTQTSKLKPQTLNPTGCPYVQAVHHVQLRKPKRRRRAGRHRLGSVALVRLHRQPRRLVEHEQLGAEVHHTRLPAEAARTGFIRTDRQTATGLLVAGARGVAACPPRHRKSVDCPQSGRRHSDWLTDWLAGWLTDRRLGGRLVPWRVRQTDWVAGWPHGESDRQTRWRGGCPTARTADGFALCSLVPWRVRRTDKQLRIPAHDPPTPNQADDQVQARHAD